MYLFIVWLCYLIIITLGMDGYLRIWHKDDKFQPLFIRNFKGDIKDVQWDPKGLGFYMVIKLY